MLSSSFTFIFGLCLLWAGAAGRIKLDFEPGKMSETGVGPESGLKVDKIKCKNDIIRAFGLKTTSEDDKPFLADHDELDYCRRNKYSCCSGSDYAKMVPKYFKSHQAMQKLIEPIEEVATLFKGPKLGEEILAKLTQERIKDRSCSMYSVAPKTGAQIDFSLENKDTLSLYLEMQSLMSELDFYVKRQGWFYGNILCSICNPEDQEYLKVDDGKLTVTSSASTCSELFDMKEWEVRLGFVYSRFLRPMANTYKCVHREGDEPLKSEEVLPELNLEFLEKLFKSFRVCSGEFSIDSEDCLTICRKSLSTFSFSEEILTAYIRALQFFFPVLTDMTIEDYYAQRKSQAFAESIVSSVQFFEVSAFAPENLVLRFKDHGINIFNNHWSKKWQEYSRVKVKATAATTD